MRWPRVATLVVVGGSAAVVAAEVVLAVRYRSRLSEPLPEVLALVGAFGLVGAVAVAAALLVSSRAPDTWVGPVLATLGLEAVLFGGASVPDPTTAPPAWLDRFLDGSWMWFYVPIGLLLTVFPSGRPVNRAGRVAAAGLPAVALVFQGVAATDAPRPVQALGVALLPVFLGLLVTAAVSLVQRYRHGDRVLRAQVRWIMLVGWCLPLTLAVGWLAYFVTGGSGVVVGVGLALLYAALPVATAVAMLRHRLYDVDDALVTTVAYGGMLVVVLLAFLGATAVSGLVVGRSSTTAAVLVTTVVAFTLGSVRARVESAVALAVFPARERALRGVAALQEAVGRGAAAPEDVVDVLRDTLRDPGLRVTYGASPAPDGSGTPAVLGGATVGHLHAGPTAGREPPREVAAAAALLLETVRLRADLAQALREAEDSRERLLVAGYEERRRLERDLHDGAQQRLVSLGLRLRLIQRSLGPDRAPVVDDLDEAVAQVSTAVAELRRLAHGIRPSSLDDGLRVALAHLHRTSPVPLHLDLDDSVDAGHAGSVPDPVATTAYFVAAEAVANAVRYAGAARITVRLRRDGLELVLRVADDGCGGARLLPGAGLAGLRDRVGAVGGRLAVTSPVGSGTVVEARLPCAS